MARTVALALLGVMVWIGTSATAAADAPLCALAPELGRLAMRSEAKIGAAVYDLESGAIWSGGAAGSFALHSVVKPPIAWAVLTSALEQERELSNGQRRALRQMVVHSENANVLDLLRLIGGLEGLKQYYERWGVGDLAAQVDEARWGRGRATPSQTARLYGALAMSEAVPPLVRAEGLDLLHAVVERQRWGATIPSGTLPGWTALIKTGNYSFTASRAGSSDEQADDNQTADTDAATEAATEAGASQGRGMVLVRMNSAAIWLGPPWQGAAPRYVIAIMQEGYLSWSESRQLQDRLGAVIAEAIVRRESGAWSPPPAHCLKRALS